MKRSGIGDLCCRLAAGAVGGLTVAFLMAPVVLVVYLSFSKASYIDFPVSDFGLQRYHEVADDPKWLDALVTSVKVAVPVAVVTAVIGSMTVLAIHRTRLAGRRYLQPLGVVAMLIPGAAYATALYGLFADLNLIGSYIGILVAHVLISLPFVIIMMNAAMIEVPRNPELVAMTLGATRGRAWLDILVPVLRPALVVSLLVSFFVSFDEATLITFLGGGEIVTVPKAMFDSVLFGLRPEVTAVASLLIVGILVLCAALIVLRRKLRVNEFD